MKYKNKYFIRLYNIAFEVSREEYIQFYKEKRRYKYLMEAEKKLNILYYDSLDSNHCLGEDIIPDTTVDIANEVCKKILIEKMWTCLKQLSKDELFLIIQLFCLQKSERQLSAIMGIPQKTINDRKAKILKKLKKLMDS